MRLISNKLKEELESVVEKLSPDGDKSDKYHYLVEGVLASSKMMLESDQHELPLDTMINKVILIKRFIDDNHLADYDHVISTGIYVRHDLVVFKVSEELYSEISRSSMVTTEMLKDSTTIDPDIIDQLDLKTFKSISYEYGVLLKETSITDDYIWRSNQYELLWNSDYDIVDDKEDD